jgi:hypothetical protein
MNNGDYLRDRGCALVEANNHEFVEAMRFHAKEFIKQAGSVSVDELRAKALELRLKPTHQNAWGSIFRTKDFKAVGFKKSQVQSNHSRRVIIWGAA